jgi:hypothetical protein
VGTISHANMTRIVSATTPRGAGIEELEQIAAACGVPLQFLEVGFAPLERPITDVEMRLRQLEAELDQRFAGLELLRGALRYPDLLKRMLDGETDAYEQLVAAAKEPAAGDDPEPASAAVRRLRDQARTDAAPGQDETPPAEDAHGGSGR